ncbi:MAG: BatD family protein [Candidatus Krumholzibacteriota bacterium]|nr:BatD family protein [Candidatus Krumholzibacteriota bacterium]
MNPTIRIISAIFLAVAIAAPLAAQDVEVRIEVETRDVYAGESFLAQIVVDGADDVEPPDLGELDGFSVEYLGGSNNSSQQIAIVNGRMQRTVQKSFLFTWRLTPTRVGRLVIPAIDVRAGGGSFRTRPVSISARRPEETEDFKLRIRLSRETCYVGEPVVLSVTWYLRRDVQDFSFTAPLLESADFRFADPEVEIDPNRRYFRVPLGGGETIAEKGKGILDGENYATLSFRKAVIPLRAGTFDIPPIIVQCEAGTGISGRGDLFDRFFNDDFFRTSRTRPQKYVVPSNELLLDVKPLPREGRPAGFAGHVGEYRISTTAEPTEVNVGDPITLTIVLEGPDYLGGVDLPPLAGRPEFAERFKVPAERADGRVEGKRKIFTQTLRALDDEVDEIPPVRLDYFDTAERRYETAASEPIPLVVRPTRVVTASDAEGVAGSPAAAPIERWKEGIAYNYEGPGVTEAQPLGPGALLAHPARLALLVAPPAVYALLLGGLLVSRRRRSDPAGRRARSAFRRLRRRLDAIAADAEANERCERALEALREYIGDKLRRPGATLTAADIERLLAGRGVSAETIRVVVGVIGTCEMGSYAGGLSAGEDGGELAGRVAEAAGLVEKELG